MAEEPYHSPPPPASSFAHGVAYYVSVLLSGQLQERVIAAETLGDMGDLRAVEPLIKALDDPATEVRWVAAKSLGMLGDPRAVPPSDTGTQVRRQMVAVRGSIQPREAWRSTCGGTSYRRVERSGAQCTETRRSGIGEDRR